MSDLNLENILRNAIEASGKSIKTEHILSNISFSEVLTLCDENNTLKIFTSEHDIFNLDNSAWNKVSSNNEEGFATFTSEIDETIKLLIDERNVDFI